MTQKNEDARVIAAECIRQSEEGCYERALFRRAGELIQQLIAELEAVGAGGVQPLRAKAGWVLVPVEPTQEMLEAAVQAICYGPGGGFTRISGPHRCWSAMLTVAPKAPQQAAPKAPERAASAPPQKPELRVGQIWMTRGCGVAEVKSKTTNPKYPFLCVTDDCYPWTVTEDGMYWHGGAESHVDLIELISDVPQKGGEA